MYVTGVPGGTPPALPETASHQQTASPETLDWPTETVPCSLEKPHLCDIKSPSCPPCWLATWLWQEPGALMTRAEYEAVYNTTAPAYLAKAADPVRVS